MDMGKVMDPRKISEGVGIYLDRIILMDQYYRRIASLGLESEERVCAGMEWIWRTMLRAISRGREEEGGRAVRGVVSRRARGMMRAGVGGVEVVKGVRV